jgi:spermidine/putrescine transport system substrate-binding protein
LADDLLEPLPARIMPAWEEVTGRFDLDRYRRDSDIYALPQTRTLFPLQYNLNEFDEAPGSWGILWDDAYDGQIVMKDDAVVSCQIAALYTGQDPTNPVDFEDIKSALQQQRPLVHSYWSSRYDARRLFEAETVLIGPLTQAATCLCAEDKAPIRWTVPAEGTMSTHSAFVIPTGAPNPRTAVRFVDWGLRRKITTTETWSDDWDLHYASRLSTDVADRYEDIWSEIRGA